jgi:flagellar motor switch protein FliG
MFTFEDLIRLDTFAIQTILRTTPKDKLLLALKGSSPQIRELFLKNMSSRAAKMVEEDLESLGPVRLREVEEAQSSVLSLAKELNKSGQITINQKGESDELIY